MRGYRLAVGGLILSLVIVGVSATEPWQVQHHDQARPATTVRTTPELTVPGSNVAGFSVVVTDIVRGPNTIFLTLWQTNENASPVEIYPVRAFTGNPRGPWSALTEQSLLSNPEFITILPGESRTTSLAVSSDDAHTLILQIPFFTQPDDPSHRTLNNLYLEIPL